MTFENKNVVKHNKTFISSYYDYRARNYPYPIQNQEHFAMKSDEIDHLHFHECIELGICVSGAGECYTESEIYSFQAGDVQVFLPYQKHYSRSFIGETTNWYFISFELENIKRLNEKFDEDSIEKIINERIICSGIIRQSEHPDIAQIVTEISNETLSPNKLMSFELTCKNIEKLFILLARYADVNDNPKYVIDRNLKLILPALNAMSSNLQEIESANEIAKICSMSMSNTRRIFNELFGISPQKYLLIKKMKRAHDLLIDDKLSIREVSDLAGFTSTTCFYRNFKNYYGISPMQYRQQQLSHNNKEEE